MKTIKEIAKELYPKEDTNKIAGKMAWEVMGEMGYTDKGQFQAYKQLMVNLSIMQACHGSTEK